MKKLNLIALTAVTILFSALASFAQSAYTVKGKISNWPTDKVYLVRQGNYPGVDSVATKDGSFEFKGTIEGPTTAYLITQKKGGTAKFIYVEPGTISINGDYATLKDVEIQGSPTYNDFKEVRDGHEKFTIEMNKYIELQLGTEDSTLLKQYYQRMDSISLADIEFSKSFIKSHPDSDVSLLEIESLNKSINNSELKELFDLLSDRVKSSPQGNVLSGNLPYMGMDLNTEADTQEEIHLQ